MPVTGVGGGARGVSPVALSLHVNPHIFVSATRCVWHSTARFGISSCCSDGPIALRKASANTRGLHVASMLSLPNPLAKHQIPCEQRPCFWQYVGRQHTLWTGWGRA